ncbi:hypothetical protein [Halanaerobaculum tunisiense]
MKKNLLVIFGVVISLFLMTTIVGAADVDKDNVKNFVGENTGMKIGIGLPNVGWAQHNEKGQITGYKGFNLGLGYSQKNYFEAGLKEGQFNSYWGWGTILVALPYIETGTDYVFAAQNDSFWTAGGAIGLYSLVPGARVSLSYNF